MLEHCMIEFKGGNMLANVLYQNAHMYACLYACNICRESNTEIRVGCHEKHTACMRMVSYNKCSRMKMKK